MILINNASLLPFVTFGVEASCERLYKIEDREELILAVRHLQSPLVLGGGSNVLPIGNLKKDVLKIELKGINIEEKPGQDPIVHIAAGENWHEFVLWAIEHELGGVENLSLIPGTAGAAPIQNIGAYGVELDGIFHSLEAVRMNDGRVMKFDKAECKFGYRDSIFKREAKDQFVITSIALRLTRDHQLNTSYGAIQDILRERSIPHPTIRDVSNAVIYIRQSKLPDPAVIGNAGSFFKNPVIEKEQYEMLKADFPHLPGYPMDEKTVKVPAGWLIEHAGWKGKSLGKVGCYEKQALVLVNLGGASGEEVWTLAEEIMSSVRNKFGIHLTPEVNIWRS